MANLDFDEILAEWSKVYLIGDYADWKIEIDNNINKEQYFAKLIYLPYSKERPTMADGHSSIAFLNSDV